MGVVSVAKPCSRPKAVASFSASSRRSTCVCALTGRATAASKARRWRHSRAATAYRRRRLMLSLRGQVLDRGRVAAQSFLDDADTQTRPRQQRRFAAMAEAHAVDADVFGQEHRAERAFDECDVGERGGEMAAGGGKNGGLADLTADLDANAGRTGAQRDGQRRREASALRDAHVEEVDRLGLD